MDATLNKPNLYNIIIKNNNEAKKQILQIYYNKIARDFITSFRDYLNYLLNFS